MTFPITFALTVRTLEILSRQKIMHWGIINLYIVLLSYKLKYHKIPSITSNLFFQLMKLKFLIFPP